jgi:hypothetical protein
VAVSCDECHKPSGSVKEQECIDYLSDCHFTKKDPFWSHAGELYVMSEPYCSSYVKYWLKYIVTCLCDYRRGFGFEIGFINPLQVVTTNHYDTIANFLTFQIATAHAKSFQSAAVSTCSSLVTASNNGDSSTKRPSLLLKGYLTTDY